MVLHTAAEYFDASGVQRGTDHFSFISWESPSVQMDRKFFAALHRQMRMLSETMIVAHNRVFLYYKMPERGNLVVVRGGFRRGSTVL
jgi:hypothetical protein